MSPRNALAAPLVWLAVDAIAAAAGTTELEPRVTATWSVRVQADGDWLQVIEETTVLRASDPPATVANDRPFEMRLPPEAEVVAGAMQTRGGQARNIKPVPGDREGDHYFPGPLPPGETRFAVAYRLRYRGQALLRPGIPYPLSRVEIALPDSMTFEPETAGLFDEERDEAVAIVREMASPKPGQSAAFRVSGKGSLTNIRIPGNLNTGQTVPSHSGQNVSSHADLTAPSHGGAAAAGGPIVAARPDRRLLVGGLIAALLVGSAVLVGYKKKRPRRLLA